MKRFHKTLALTIASWGIMVVKASALITIDSVYVGDIGNPNDSTGYGGVNYGYSIGKYEVTLNQYSAFLNAVGATDTYELYDTQMGSDPNIMGIARTGVSGSYTYSVIGSGNRPVTYVSWFDSARFVNWLHNGQPTGAQAAGTTETGAYSLNGNLSAFVTRNDNATYGLPTENEWYKAAYYQPASQGGESDGYWQYPTANNAGPNSRNGSESDPNSANWFFDRGIDDGFNGGYAVSQSHVYSATQQYLTDVGAFSLADSFYGTLDQAGNVWEWHDTASGAGTRGGGWDETGFGPTMAASWRGNDYTRYGFANPAMERSTLGFRIAIVPEPSVVGLMGLGMAMLAWQRKRTL